MSGKVQATLQDRVLWIAGAQSITEVCVRQAAGRIFVRGATILVNGVHVSSVPANHVVEVRLAELCLTGTWLADQETTAVLSFVTDAN
jgi:hypothetical protein